MSHPVLPPLSGGMVHVSVSIAPSAYLSHITHYTLISHSLVAGNSSHCIFWPQYLAGLSASYQYLEDIWYTNVWKKKQQQKTQEVRTCNYCYRSLDREGFPGGTVVKEPTCHFRRRKRHGFDPWVRKICWGRKWQPTPGFVPENSLAQRSPEGHIRWGCKGSDMTKRWQLSQLHQIEWTNCQTHEQLFAKDLLLPAH